MASDPISRERDPRVRSRRLAIVQRDVALKVQGGPCETCGNTSWLLGGKGCDCVGKPTPEALTARCLANAAMARAEPDTDWSESR